MEGCKMYMHSNSSGSSIQFLNTVTINNRAAMINQQNHVMDLKKLSSRIICSDNITRQNLYKKPSTSTVTIPMDDDDEEFFKKIESEINKKHFPPSKENYRLDINYQNTNPMRKKRPIIDEETQKVIKRFKKDTNYTNSIQSLNNTNITPYNHIKHVTKEQYNILRNVNKENITQNKNMFSSNVLNTDFRIPASKYVFQMTSKLKKDVLPLPIDETTILHEEYEESLFYGMMFLTPPDTNSIEDNTDT